MKKAPQKVYVVDNGFIKSSAFHLSDDLGRLLENQVFIELLRQGYNTTTSLFYYHSHTDKEVDFVLRRGAMIERLVQVCYDLSNPRTAEREMDALVESAEELHCMNLQIITFAETRTITHKGYTIQVIPISHWK